MKKCPKTLSGKHNFIEYTKDSYIKSVNNKTVRVEEFEKRCEYCDITNDYLPKKITETELMTDTGGPGDLLDAVI